MKSIQLHAALAAAILAGTAASAGAQMLGGIAVAPATVTAGQQATVTVQFEVQGAANCGIRLHWGDGSSTDYKINQAKDVPLVVPHAWANAGSFTVKAEPKTQGMTPRCGGRNQEALVQVTAPAVVAPARPGASAAAPTAAAPMARTSPCPAGWTLGTGGVGKNGAYACQAKAGTALPAQRVSCPGELTYYENAKRGQLGCRP